MNRGEKLRSLDRFSFDDANSAENALLNTERCRGGVGKCAVDRVGMNNNGKWRGGNTLKFRIER